MNRIVFIQDIMMQFRNIICCLKKRIRMPEPDVTIHLNLLMDFLLM